MKYTEDILKIKGNNDSSILNKMYNKYMKSSSP